MLGFLFKNRRRQKLLQAPLPGDWRAIIMRNVAAYALLSPSERRRLDDAVKIIVAERPFVGCGGLTIDAEVKVTIAAQAALLLLGEEGYYFDRVPTIFVHPHWPKTKTGRVVQEALFSEPVHVVEEGVEIDGQMLSQDEIRLVWDEVLYGSRDPADGENVVLHEFAHHLDALDGATDGIPPLTSENERRAWLKTFDAALAQHQRDVKRGREVFLHEEAAGNRAELFAYATECFFEQPLDLAELHPELFACLRGFYKIDPRQWFKEEG
jgi:Mlc titration factor MtfA (ptsG expression regulator)